mmetsp:Transcript_46297/g.72438  ORF Transcript_46297/g.72438 Transcript_46297/m.72438 type:complete len:216 (-) Transcript_46297:18-665(-)
MLSLSVGETPLSSMYVSTNASQRLELSTSPALFPLILTFSFPPEASKASSVPFFAEPSSERPLRRTVWKEESAGKSPDILGLMLSANASDIVSLPTERAIFRTIFLSMLGLRSLEKKARVRLFTTSILRDFLQSGRLVHVHTNAIHFHTEGTNLLNSYSNSSKTKTAKPVSKLNTSLGLSDICKRQCNNNHQEEKGSLKELHVTDTQTLYYIVIK